MKIRPLRRRLPLFLFLLAAGCILLPATVMAQSGPRHGDDGPGHFTNPRHLMRIADKLELDDDQRQEIRQLLEENRDKIRPLRQQLRRESAALREMIADDDNTEEQVLEHLDKVLDMEARIKRKRVSMMLEIRDILDEDQRALAQELFEERRQRMGDRHQRRQQRRQQRRGQ